VVDFDRVCSTCKHRSLKHRDFVGACRECHCKSFTEAGGRKPVSPLKATRADRDASTLQSRYGLSRLEVRGLLASPHVHVDIGTELSKEAQRLSKPKKGGKR
jgi:hypothetical protein